MDNTMTIQDLRDWLAGEAPVPETELLPAEESVYETLARECYHAYDPVYDSEAEFDAEILLAHERWFNNRNRIVCLLRHMLSRDDDRAVRAVLWIAQFASENPEHAHEGINPLAGLSSFLWRQSPSRYTDEELVARFERYEDLLELSVNSWQCLKSIAHRRPELRSPLLDRPPRRDREPEEPDTH